MPPDYSCRRVALATSKRVTPTWLISSKTSKAAGSSCTSPDSCSPLTASATCSGAWSHPSAKILPFDICNPTRLHRAAKVCEDWGMRIQYSVFECRLEAQSFALFWDELSAIIDPKVDRIVAYKICTRCAREIHSLGTQVHYEQVVAYVC